MHAAEGYPDRPPRFIGPCPPGGQRDLIITGAATVIPHAKAGRIKVIAFAAKKRHANWPDIPAAGEAELKYYEAGTPRAVINSLNGEIVATLTTTDLKDRLTAVGADASSRRRRWVNT